jgi:DNA transformation protein and related proteins
MITNPVEAPPYPKAKPYFLIDEQLYDRDWLTALIGATANELPLPKPKKSKTPKASVK